MAERIQVVMGRAGSGKTTYCYQQIAKAQIPGGRRIILWVPDQATYVAERGLAQHAAGGGYMHVDVLGPARLAYRVLDTAHTGRGKHLSGLGEQLVLRYLLATRKDDFRILNRAAKQTHFAEVLARELNELQLYRVKPADLTAVAANVSPGLADKLHDMSTLYEAYLAHVQTYFPETLQQEELIAAIRGSEWIAESDIFIDGFQGFSPRDEEVVRALVETAHAVTVTLTMDPTDPDSGRAESALFHRSWQTWQWLKGLGKEVDTISLTQTHRFSPESGLAHLEAAYFARRPALSQAIPGLEITAYHSPEEEVDRILQQVCRLVRDEGYRYRDIAILLRAHEPYTDLLVRACAHYEVPYFTDQRRSMRFDALTVLLTEAVKLAVYGWQTDGVLRLLKTGLGPLDAAETDELEYFCREFGIEQREWYYRTRWGYRKPRQLEEPELATEEEEARWDRIDSYRCRLMDWLAPVIAAHAPGLTIRERSVAMVTWLQDSGVSDRLARSAETMDAEHYQARRQVYRRIMEVWEEWVSIAGEEVWEPTDVATVWLDSLRNLSYSIIPPTLDHVTITTIDRGHDWVSPVVFVPGQNEGVFPARPAQAGLWTDRDRAELAAQSVYIGPDSVRQTLMEQLWLYLAWTRATEKLYLSYAISGPEGEVQEPSFMVSRLARLGTEKGWIETREFTAADHLVRPKQALAQLPHVLRHSQDLDELALYRTVAAWATANGRHDLVYDWTGGYRHTNQTAILAPDMARQLYMNRGKLVGSVTAFETYRQCPFRFYAKYGLRLDDPPEAKLTYADFGTYLHAGLKRFGDTLLQEGRQWRDVREEEIRERTAAIAEEIAPNLQNDVLARDAYHRYIRYRLDETFAKTVARLVQWSRQGVFDTVSLESRFYLPLNETKHTKLALTGIIDRLDTYTDPETGKIYYLVIDYKTGNVTVDMDMIYYGLRLQLATYLYAVTTKNWGKGIPAGIMYVYVQDESQRFSYQPTDAERENTIRKALRAQGYFLGEHQVLGRLDDRFGTELSFLPIRVNKDHSIHADKAVMKASDLYTILEYVPKILVDICQEITEGDIAVRPYVHKQEKACTYCPYRRLCQHDPRQGGMPYRMCPPLRKEDALAEMKAVISEEMTDTMGSEVT